MSMMGIDRQAFLVYLRDCRDIEVELYQLNNMLTKEQRDYEQKIEQAQYQYQPYQSGMPEKPQLWNVDEHEMKREKIWSNIWGIISGIIALSFIPLAIIIFWFAGNWLGAEIEFIIAWWFLFTITFKLSEIYGEGRKENEEYLHYNQTAIENYNLAVEQYKQLCTRTQQYREVEQQLTQQHDQTMTALNAQKQKVEALREEIYKVNLIPKQYRDVSHMYYIYDYMSTSQATFEDTLNHAHLENGFQRILDKLEEIIAQQYQQIHEAREMEARSKADSERTLNMLHRLGEQSRAANAQLAGMNSTMGQIAENTSNAAYYAEIAADYSKVSAYFDTYDHFMQ